MRIAVVGAGGVGGYFGGRLANAGIDTTFFVRGSTLEALRAKPLRVESINGGGEQSEIDAQIGAVARMARELGVPAPVSETLYALLIPSRP